MSLAPSLNLEVTPYVQYFIELYFGAVGLTFSDADLDNQNELTTS